MKDMYKVSNAADSSLPYATSTRGSQDLKGVVWEVADMMQLPYDDGSECAWVGVYPCLFCKYPPPGFDVVLDKGAMDAVLAADGDQFEPPPHTVKAANTICEESYRVLSQAAFTFKSPSGSLISGCHCWAQRPQTPLHRHLKTPVPLLRATGSHGSAEESSSDEDEWEDTPSEAAGAIDTPLYSQSTAWTFQSEPVGKYHKAL